MISLSVVKVRVGDKKYLMTRCELEQVRAIMAYVHTADARASEKRLQEVLATKHTFANGKKYALVLDTVKITEEFYVWSSRHSLSMNEVAQIKKLISCAITAPNTMLLFPDYIVISPVPPPVIKPARKRKKNGTK